MLIAIRPFQGHLEPVVPIARVLRDAGHEVMFATQERFCAVVERCGFTCRAAGLDPFVPAPSPGYEFSEAVTRHKLDDILAIAAVWPFELILRDPTDFAAVITAEALGVPQATIGFARYTPPWWWRHVLGSSLDAIRRKRGLNPDPAFQQLHPSLYIDTVPPWLQAIDDPLPEVLYRVRPEPFQVPASGTTASILHSSQPLVMVTLGTVFNRRPQLVDRLCRGAARAGTKVICTLGPGLGASELKIGDIEGIQVTGYVPIGQLLPRCGVVVCHGGYNTVLASVLNGVPLIVVPLGADNAFNARRCEQLGVGVHETAATATEARIAELVSRLLSHPTYREAAQELAGRTAELPPVVTAVPRLERLAESRALATSRAGE